MDMSGTSLNAVLFLFSCIFDFYILILFVRFLLATVNADYHHPLTQFVVKLTSFIIVPMKKIIPDFRGYESATIVLILLVVLLKWLMLILLSYGIPNLLGLIILAIGDSIKLLLETLSLALIFQAILSWIQPGSPVYQVLSKATSPITRPMQRVIPLVSGIDITPLIAIVVLQLLVIIFASPLIAYGLAVSIGS
jgi:YggT family protein